MNQRTARIIRRAVNTKDDLREQVALRLSLRAQWHAEPRAFHARMRKGVLEAPRRAK